MSHLTFYEHIEEDVIALRLLGAGFKVPGGCVCAGGRGCAEKRAGVKTQAEFPAEGSEMGRPAGRTGSVLEVERM